MSTQVAIAFTRYPYPESFFSWHGDDKPMFFNRTDRPPAWMPESSGARRFPVFLVPDPPGAALLRHQIDSYGAARYHYVVLQTDLGGQPYQVIARLMYTNPLQEEPDAVIGFTVNLRWIRKSYFAEIFPQVVRLADREHSLEIGVFDEKKDLRWGAANKTPTLVRQFPILFVDPSLGTLAVSDEPAIAAWNVHVSQARDSPLTLVSQGAHRALFVSAGAAMMLCLGLVLAIKSIRAEVALATMRSDFVSSVTHELKMPLANIRLMADRLALQPAPAEKISRYAGLLRQESKRLGQLIDNLLAYARVTDVADVYSFEPINVEELVRDGLRSFEEALIERQFTVGVDIPADLPRVRADRAALILVLDNLFENVIRYSTESRTLSVSARRDGSFVVLEIRDTGPGIPARDLSKVRGKFVRGKGALPHGTGLGLAIVDRVIADHRGRFSLESECGAGTAALIGLPVAR
jgi:signal transduction histidine kinase